METFFFFAINEYLILHIWCTWWPLPRSPIIHFCRILSLFQHVACWHLCSTFSLLSDYTFHVQCILSNFCLQLFSLSSEYISSMCSVYSNFCLQLFSLSSEYMHRPCAIYTLQLFVYNYYSRWVVWIHLFHVQCILPNWTACIYWNTAINLWRSFGRILRASLV